MSAGWTRRLLSLVGGAMSRGGRVCWTPASESQRRSVGWNVASNWARSFSTEVNNNVKQTPAVKTKTPQDQSSINNVGRKIPHREIQVMGEGGEDLGVMHRGSVIRLMDEKNLKLVLLNANKDPPVYQLMRGKQIHEEQLKLKNQLKPAPVQVKELTFSVGIGPHDLSTKLKQVESWLEKKHHVRITLQAKRNQAQTDLVGALEEAVGQMSAPVGFVSKPGVVREGRSAACVLRPPSKKELAQKGTRKAAGSTESAGPASDESLDQSPPAGNTGAPEESVQQ